jgi:hypothetical protein
MFIFFNRRLLIFRSGRILIISSGRLLALVQGDGLSSVHEDCLSFVQGDGLSVQGDCLSLQSQFMGAETFQHEIIAFQKNLSFQQKSSHLSPRGMSSNHPHGNLCVLGSGV